MPEIIPEQIVQIIYTNYRWETDTRDIMPIKIWFGKTERHPEDQRFLDAIDISKNALRNFAIKDIKSWSAKRLETEEQIDNIYIN